MLPHSLNHDVFITQFGQGFQHKNISHKYHHRIFNAHKWSGVPYLIWFTCFSCVIESSCFYTWIPCNLQSINFSQHCFEQTKYFLPFVEGKSIYRRRIEAPVRLKGWAWLSHSPLIPELPSPFPSWHQHPSNLSSMVCGFCHKIQTGGDFSFSQCSIFILFIIVLQGHTVLWTSWQNWRAYFYRVLLRAFLLVCTCSYVDEQGLQELFCLGQWNS